VEGPFGLVVGDGGVGLGVSGGALHVAQRDALEQADRDVGAAQRMRGDPLGDARAGRESPQQRGSVVGLHPVPPLVTEQRPGGATGGGLAHGLLGSRVEDHLGGLIALAEDAQGRLVARPAEVGDVDVAGFRYAQPVEAEQAHQRVGVPRCRPRRRRAGR
jgi:hypothetical protein